MLLNKQVSKYRLLEMQQHERPVLPQISQIHADERQVDQMALLKQMPLISLTKTVTTLRKICSSCCLLFVCENLRNLREIMLFTLRQ